MKNIVLLALVLAFAVSIYATTPNPENYWFRITNHIGASTPAAIKVKTCGLANVYVNAKDSGRMGFGYDLRPQLNPNVGGMCTGGCGSTKRTFDPDFDTHTLRTDSDDDVGETNALYATDLTVNFGVFWNTDSNGNLINGNKIMTRIAHGDIAFVLGSDTSLSLDSVDSANQYSTVTAPDSSVVSVKHYPQAVFQFNDANRIIKQNWQLEFANDGETCVESAPENNEIVSEYGGKNVTAVNYGNWGFKTRVRFDFAEDAAANGMVHVTLTYNSSTGRFLKRIRGSSGADFAPSWLSDISVYLTATDGAGTVVLIDDDNNSGPQPITTYVQNCSPSDMSNVAVKRTKPLASSSF